MATTDHCALFELRGEFLELDLLRFVPEAHRIVLPRCSASLFFWAFVSWCRIFDPSLDLLAGPSPFDALLLEAQGAQVAGLIPGEDECEGLLLGRREVRTGCLARRRLFHAEVAIAIERGRIHHQRGDSAHDGCAAG